MANPKGNPQYLIPFKKGQSGNLKGAPKGQHKATKELIEAKAINRTIFVEKLNAYAKYTNEEMLEAKKNPKTPVLDLLVLAVISNGIKHGDDRRLGFLLDYLIGKNTEKVEVKGSLNTAIVQHLELVAKKNTDE